MVGGFIDREGARGGIGALLVGYHEGDALRFGGKVGAGRGFTAKFLSRTRRELEKIAGARKLHARFRQGRTRAGKILIDYERNHRAAVPVAAAYSTLAHPEGTLPVPVGWRELISSLSPRHFTGTQRLRTHREAKARSVACLLGITAVTRTCGMIMRRWRSAWQTAW